MKRPLTTSTSSSSSTSSSACIVPTQPETPRPKRAKRAKKSSLPCDAVKPQNPTSPASTRRSSIYRGVTRHRWTGRYEAHLWDKSSWNSIQNKKGKQVYLGAYDSEEAAAHTYDLAALKYWGPDTILNFPVETYAKELEEMQRGTKEEYLASLRRQSSGFSRGVSKYRGVARHHHNGRWEARIGRVFGNKYLYLGTYNTQEEAAAAYDMAAIEYRGANAVTNFDISNYIDRLKKKGVFPFPVSQANHHQEAVLAVAKQEVEAKEEPTEEVKQCVEQEEVKEEKTEKEVEEAVVTCCIDSSTIMEMERSSDSNELAWDFCMMDSGFAPFLTDSNLSSENPIEYPELFNEMMGFEDNIDFMFEEGKSLENLDCCDGVVVVGRESPTSLSSSPLSCLSTDSASSSTTTTTTITSVSCNYSV